MHYRLTGMAFWYKSEATAKGESTRELHSLNPLYMELVPDAMGGIAGYLFRAKGQTVPFDPAEIIMFRRSHPLNDVYGLAMSRLASRS
jgi:hypothetical protein